MHTNTKLMMTFLMGAAAGGLLSYVLYKERIEQAAEEEIESMKEYYQNLIEEIDEDHDRELDKLIRVLDEEEQISSDFVDYTEKYSSDEGEEYVRVEKENNDMPGYTPQKIIKPVEEMEEYREMYNDILEGEDELEDGFEEDPHNLDFEEDEPYIISVEDFEYSMNHLDKITLFYYDYDDILTDEMDEVIPDPTVVVGMDALTSFGDRSGDKNIVYIRNPHTKTDYEVVKMQDSFQERILGIRGD